MDFTAEDFKNLAKMCQGERRRMDALELDGITIPVIARKTVVDLEFKCVQALEEKLAEAQKEPEAK